ncbi:class I SAM-dependent methyltransferase [Micromonospora sp. NPDC048999]|uniref:class I SAM-dependent methyltransferase n=1 Tax=Micromonospora sp. NPDC048999 TaxID=3155391 RepID=UPI00340E32A8
MSANRDVEELIAEGAGVPVEGWDFSWFAGRATEERPPWGYARLVGARMATVDAALDIDTGGGEVLAEVPAPPPLLVATEAWPPNVAVARRTLRRVGATVVQVAERAPLPFRDATFDLVVSRHPVDTPWDEIARVLRPGGSYLSQQIGPGTVRELSEAILGPLPPPANRHPEQAVAAAEAAGLTVVDLRTATLRTVFHDIAAVVCFLRKVIWTVPGFTVERHHAELRRMHDRIRAEGPFVAHAQRFLIEAHHP